MSDQDKGGLNIFIHPLVVVNISDHYTREHCVKPNPRVFGCLLGQQEGRRVEISNSFEMLLEDGQVDTEFMKTRQDQFFRVFENCEILGWYATGVSPSSSDLHIHEQMEIFNESPLFLLLNPDQKANVSGDLAFSVMESVIKIVNSKPTTQFSKLRFSIETTEMERIGVDHVANVTLPGASPYATHASTLHQAIKMLNSRISIVRFYLEDLKAGKVKSDQSILREIASVCQQLPAIDSEEFTTEFFTEYNDALLLAYLSSITKASNALNEMLEKFNVSHDRQLRRRGPF